MLRGSFNANDLAGEFDMRKVPCGMMKKFHSNFLLR